MWGRATGSPVCPGAATLGADARPVDLNAPQTCAEAPGPTCFCECPAGYSAYVVSGPTSGNWQKICAKGGDPNDGIPCGAPAPSPSPSGTEPEGDDGYEEPPPSPWLGFRWPPTGAPVTLTISEHAVPPLEIAVNVRQWTATADYCVPLYNSFQMLRELSRFAAGDFAMYEDEPRTETFTLEAEDVPVLEADEWRQWGLRRALVGTGPDLAGAAIFEIPDQDTSDFEIRGSRTRTVIFAGERCQP